MLIVTVSPALTDRWSGLIDEPFVTFTSKETACPPPPWLLKISTPPMTRNTTITPARTSRVALCVMAREHSAAGRPRLRPANGRYDRRIVWGSWLRRAAVPVAILAGSELGHAIVYSARFGLDAGGRQATGAHAYLPALAGGLSAVLGTVLMTSLLVV